MELFQDDIVAIAGGTALFRCETSGESAVGPVEWHINGNSLEDTVDMNVTTLGRESLVFSNVSMGYNNTFVQCGVGDSHSGIGSLIVQGIIIYSG